MRMTSRPVLVEVLALMPSLHALAQGPSSGSSGYRAADLLAEATLVDNAFVQDKVAPKSQSGTPFQELQSMLDRLQPKPRSRVLCGTTLLPADPKVDPKIRTSAPKGHGRSTMRIVQPKACQGTKTRK